MSLYSNIFDAHAHYDDKWFDDDRFELLENIHTKGVCGIVNNAVDLETAKICIEYAEKYDFMYAAVGWHPEDLEGILDNSYLDELAAWAVHPKVVAIGEIGLLVAAVAPFERGKVRSSGRYSVPRNGCAWPTARLLPASGSRSLRSKAAS